MSPVCVSEKDRRGVHSVVFSQERGLLAALHWHSAGLQVRGKYTKTPVISLWDAASGKLRLTHHVSSADPGEPFEFSPYDRLVFAPEGERLVMLHFRKPPGRHSLVVPTVFVWDTESPGAEPVRFEGPVGCQAVAFSPDGKTMALWRGLTYRSTQTERREPEVGKSVILWNLETGERHSVLAGHKFVVRSVAFAPDGRTIATASEDKTIKLWELGTATERVTFRTGIAKVLSVAFAPDGADPCRGELRRRYPHLPCGDVARDHVPGSPDDARSEVSHPA